MNVERELTRLAISALTVEAADAVDAGSAVEAGCASTVVDVDAAVGPGPAIHAYARVTTWWIGARGAVVAQRRSNRTLVDVQLALRARVRRWTQARVLVYPVHAGRAVLAQVPRTVVNVLLALVTAEAWNIPQRRFFVSLIFGQPVSVDLFVHFDEN